MSLTTHPPTPPGLPDADDATIVDYVNAAGTGPLSYGQAKNATLSSTPSIVTVMEMIAAAIRTHH